MSQGWVKLYRALNNWEWKDSPKHVSIFVDLLINANHKDNNYRGVLIKAGSLTTSYQAISERTGVSLRGVRTVLKDLKTTNEVTHKTTRHYSIISITNWDMYQGGDTQDAKLTTSKRQANDKLTTTNKNVKNVKNVKKTKESTFSSEFVSLFIDEEIITWCKKTGSKKIQDILYLNYNHAFLKEEISNAYFWQLENKGRKAGLFIKGWCERSNSPNKENPEIAEKKLIELMGGE